MTRIGWVAVGATWLLVIFALLWTVGLQVRQQRDDWLAKVQLVAGQTSNENHVRYWLLKPDAVVTPEVIRAKPYLLSPPPGTAKVLLYGYLAGPANIWTAYFYIGSNGQVLGHDLRLT